MLRAPTSSRETRRRPDRREAGFALILAVSLLALAVLLVLGLATLTRVETSVADIGVRQAQARANALMALHIAVGQLQKAAGPDQRVTATAETFGGVAGTRYYTGVWDSTGSGKDPLIWLVSGSESGKVDATTAPSDAVELVGAGTSGVAGDVLVRRIPITATEPGAEARTTGHYAWWVGDEGVKANVAVVDRTAQINYGPYYGTPEGNLRLRQQFGPGPGAVTLAGQEIFEPRDPARQLELSHVVAREQLGLLTAPGPDEVRVGQTVIREQYHRWTNLSRGVLADVQHGGLKQDLSQNHALLGQGFAEWANALNLECMEDPTNPAAPYPAPGYSPDPLRRRYRIGAAAAGPHMRPRIAPVLAYFYILLGIQKTTAAAPYTLSLRWAAALWNPYTSALCPEDLRLEVSGLPASISMMNADTLAVDATVSLPSLYGEPLKLLLLWDSSKPAEDRQSWLPGRVYNWVHTPDPAFTASATNAGRFYSRDLGSFAAGLVITQPGTSAVNGNTPLALKVPLPTKLTVSLYRVRDNQLLATYHSPTYEAVSTTEPSKASNSTSQLGFLFRLGESYDSAAGDSGQWLKSPATDPRRADFPAEGLRILSKGPNPAQYRNFVEIAAPWRLLDRDITWGTSYNENVPLFELPRYPILSLGMLQHLELPGARPFAIGNSWGRAATIKDFRGNEIFDQFFFSGLEADVAPNLATQPLPNQLLQVMPSKPTGEPVSLADLKSTDGSSASAHLLQVGAFNVNSTDAAAWAAVLRSNRFAPRVDFAYLDPKPSSDASSTANASTAADTVTGKLAALGSQFFRFSQSAQEVYAASAGYFQSTTNSGGSTEQINTHLFRRGRRPLTDALVEGLARAIVDTQATRTKSDASGPFRSMEEFLNPDATLTDAEGNEMSLLESAIAHATWSDVDGSVRTGLNAMIGEFSSQWLTQADLMTALAPLLTARSDTFVIRAYGSSDNAVTGKREATAICEAIVQRLPAPFQPAVAGQPTADEYHQSPGEFGRRFIIISLRWLSNGDV